MRTKTTRILTATDSTTTKIFPTGSSEPEHTCNGYGRPAHNYLLTLQKPAPNGLLHLLSYKSRQALHSKLIRNIAAHAPTNSTTWQAKDSWSKQILPQSYTQPAWNFHVAAMDVPTPLTWLGYSKLSTEHYYPHLVFHNNRSVQHAYVLTQGTLLIRHHSKHVYILYLYPLHPSHISFNTDNCKTTRSLWKLRICTTTNVLILYIFSSFYIFVTWGWPTVAETCRQPNK